MDYDSMYGGDESGLGKMGWCVLCFVVGGLVGWLVTFALMGKLGMSNVRNPLDDITPEWKYVGVATYKWPLFAWNLEARDNNGTYEYRVMGDNGKYYRVYDNRKLREGTLIKTDVPNPNAPLQKMTLRVNLVGMS